MCSIQPPSRPVCLLIFASAWLFCVEDQPSDAHGPVTQPTTRAATTQQAPPITLRAKLVSDDQVDLAWTAFPGAVNYVIELSEDGAEYHEALDMEGTGMSASLVGLGDAPSEQKSHIRVVALSRAGQRIAESNICVVTATRDR